MTDDGSNSFLNVDLYDKIFVKLFFILKTHQFQTFNDSNLNIFWIRFSWNYDDRHFCLFSSISTLSKGITTKFKAIFGKESKENVMAVIFVSKDLDFHVKLWSKLKLLAFWMKYKQFQTILEKDPCQKWKKQWRKHWKISQEKPKNVMTIMIIVSKS